MKVLVFILGLVAATASEAEFPLIFRDYHEEIGIPTARRIKLFEESLDFDGSRIVGGHPARLGAHPHLGGVLITLTNGRNSMCGSSLVTNTRAVTAAHCWRHGTHQARMFTAIFGTTHFFSGGHRTDTSMVVTHPKYDSNNVFNDVAVMYLNYVPFTEYIRGIPLATGSNKYVGVWAMAAGFGATGDSPIAEPPAKHEAYLRVISNAECAKTYGSFIVPATLCVGTSYGQNTCAGDSGGPLAVGIGADRKLIGITSFGHAADCESGQPTGFARVTSFASWIRSHL
ncbi:collagenase-like [Bicyclus anynana]|uniref:Collagenase-like n=1 Tax=Bicyclus anynana TaxID=110368 RepID=A0A6J1NCS4_BICAN|nr:collagenase-like [Bicyclus anynana]